MSQQKTNKPAPVEVNEALARSFGLSTEEYKKILEIMGRVPNHTELGIFSVMWSEHCSYKSTRIHLKKLPTTAPWVICGPGENAGVIDIGDGLAAIFKMESHNHPSFIEPYQGAATGVGGILRDVFTMGARPVANMNALRFGEPAHPKTRHLVSGVVAGIGGYGNCIGVPTVGGECNFHASYNGNILVNAMTVGVADKTKIFYSAASSIGSPVVYVGAKTGRDGIHGATMASAEFDDNSAEKRPTVQVGDPFTEKLLLEACLELMATDAILAIQDMGAAGLTSSSLEMAAKGHAGIELEMDKVPTREAGMTPYEMMLSESQERMLMVIKPSMEDMAREIFAKWEISFAVIGKITDTGRIILKMHDEIVADMPIAPLSDAAPLYERPYEATPKAKAIRAEDLQAPTSMNATLKKLLATPDLASKRWIYEQYDAQVGNNTVAKSGGDAAIVRIRNQESGIKGVESKKQEAKEENLLILDSNILDSNSCKGLAITTDCTPRYCYADPVEGGRQAVAETWRNITAVGARPLAITNCLNFGNPERPRIMGQIVGCLQGMAEACVALDYPIISGNVSLYNETSGVAVLPTPAIGGVGVIEDVARAVGNAFKNADDTIIVLGKNNGHLGASIYLREIEGREEGAPPPVDLAEERKNGEFVRSLIEQGQVTACHDIADGGLYIAIAEMALRGGFGCRLEPQTAGVPMFAYLFGEDQARYLITVRDADCASVLKAAAAAGVAHNVLGKTQAEASIGLAGEAVTIAELSAIYEGSLPAFL